MQHWKARQKSPKQQNCLATILSKYSTNTSNNLHNALFVKVLNIMFSFDSQ